MDILKSVRDLILRAFRIPKPYNWGYPVFYGAAGFAIAALILKLMFSGAFPFSSTSLIGCATTVIMIVMFAFVAPSVLIAERGGICITGHYTGIGVLILSFLSGAPVYLVKVSFHNILTSLWLKLGGTVIFPAVFYHVDGLTGQTLFLEILIDTIIPAFGFSLFFFGAVWQGFSENNKKWAFIIVPLLMALFAYDLMDVFSILIIGWWLCIVRKNTGNIYGPILALIGSRLTGILIDSILYEIDLTTIRVYSDIPSTMYFATIPAIIVAVILFAFFRKSLGEFFAAYSADIYGDEKGPEDRDGGLANSVLYGFNITLILGVLILIAFWILLTKGVRL